MTRGSAKDFGSQEYAGPAYDGQGNGGQAYGDHGYAGQGPGDQGYAQGYDAQGYDAQGQHYSQGQYGQAYDGQGYDDQGYGTQSFGDQAQGYAGQPTGQYPGYGQHPTQYPGYGDAAGGASGQGYDGQGYDGQAYGGQGYGGQGYGGQGYGGGGYDSQGYRQDYADQSTRQYEGYGDPRGGHGQGYADQDQQAWRQNGVPGPTATQRGYQGQGGRAGSPPSRPGRGDGRRGPGQRRVRFRRLRRFARRPTVRVIGALLAVFLVWVMFSAGQAAFKNNGQGFSANLAEWARDHYLGPIVTFGEWLGYNPPKVGGKPSFSYTIPKSQQVTATKTKGKHHGFVPDIPPSVKTLAAGAPLSGEGQWRVVEKVKGQPALLITFLRDPTYTSDSNGIASLDQRLVKFSLRPGTEDPGNANWGVPNYIPQGQRTGLLATFNGGFKLDAAGGGFYLNGIYHGSLINGAATIVYYKDGTIKIGQWGRDFTMNPKIEGVRQNLKLLIDHGKISPNLNQDIETKFGATLGGGYYVWRSAIGITKDNRIIYVYGQALNVQDLAELLHRAGVVEGMQMDINPAWMKFDYYQANGHPSDPTPAPLMPNQQPSPYSYYTPSTRDFTAVYAR
jgi:hypothetical protein